MFLFKSKFFLWLVLVLSFAIMVTSLLASSVLAVKWLMEDEGYLPWMCLSLAGAMMAGMAVESIASSIDKLQSADKAGVQPSFDLE